MVEEARAAALARPTESAAPVPSPREGAGEGEPLCGARGELRYFSFASSVGIEPLRQRLRPAFLGRVVAAGHAAATSSSSRLASAAVVVDERLAR